MPNSVTAACNFLRKLGRRWALLRKSVFQSLERVDDALSTFRRIGADNGIIGIWQVARPSTAQT